MAAHDDAAHTADKQRKIQSEQDQRDRNKPEAMRNIKAAPAGRFARRR